MNAKCFFDTNILVHAAAAKDGEEWKQRRVLELIETIDFGLSAQVLQEFYVTVTRKISEPMSAVEAVDWIEQFEAFPCVAIDGSHVKLAAFLSERYQISYWDGAIVAAAESLGATTLFTEDLNHGQCYASVTAYNPFVPN